MLEDLRKAHTASGEAAEREAAEAPNTNAAADAERAERVRARILEGPSAAYTALAWAVEGYKAGHEDASTAAASSAGAQVLFLF